MTSLNPRFHEPPVRRARLWKRWQFWLTFTNVAVVCLSSIIAYLSFKQSLRSYELATLVSRVQLMATQPLVAVTVDSTVSPSGRCEDARIAIRIRNIGSGAAINVGISFAISSTRDTLAPSEVIPEFTKVTQVPLAANEELVHLSRIQAREIGLCEALKHDTPFFIHYVLSYSDIGGSDYYTLQVWQVLVEDTTIASLKRPRFLSKNQRNILPAEFQALFKRRPTATAPDS